jgi:hypothetical protein
MVAVTARNDTSNIAFLYCPAYAPNRAHGCTQGCDFFGLVCTGMEQAPHSDGMVQHIQWSPSHAQGTQPCTPHMNMNDSSMQLTTIQQVVQQDSCYRCAVCAGLVVVPSSSSAVQSHHAVHAVQGLVSCSTIPSCCACCAGLGVLVHHPIVLCMLRRAWCLGACCASCAGLGVIPSCCACCP